MKRKIKIIYFYPHPSTFIMRDMVILNEIYTVIPYEFNVKIKWKTPLEFIKQIFFLLFCTRNAKIFICHFAGYSSFLPALYSKITNRNCFIIVAGNDGSKFPDFRYGNFTKKLLGIFTGESLKMATHILPVHESLYYQEYDYYKGGFPAQGYSFFYPSTKNVPYTSIPYGYDYNLFKPLKDFRKEKSFITVGNLNDNYAFKRKGFDIIIQLAQLRSDLNFTLVGWDGVKKIYVPKNVTLLPFMNTNELVEVLSEHIFYMQLSIMEGFPNALAEAMLCGCVPIGSNVSGIPFIIKDTGYILNKRNVDRLNILVNKALDNKDIKKLSEKARKRIVNNFTLENRRVKIKSVIDKYYK